MNAFIKVGDSVVFNCTVGYGGIQIWKEIHGTDKVPVATNGIVLEEFEDIYETEGATNLRLIRATLDKGLKYLCDEGLSGSIFSAQLIVLSKSSESTWSFCYDS